MSICPFKNNACWKRRLKKTIQINTTLNWWVTLSNFAIEWHDFPKLVWTTIWVSFSQFLITHVTLVDPELSLLSLSCPGKWCVNSVTKKLPYPSTSILLPYPSISSSWIGVYNSPRNLRPQRGKRPLDLVIRFTKLLQHHRQYQTANWISSKKITKWWLCG